MEYSISENFNVATCDIIYGLGAIYCMGSQIALSLLHSCRLKQNADFAVVS